MNLAIGPSPTTTIGRLLAGVLLLFAMLASSGAVADLLAASPAQTSQGGSAPLEKKAEVEEHYLAQFRAAPLSIAQAIAVAEGLHPGSRCQTKGLAALSLSLAAMVTTVPTDRLPPSN